MATVELLVLLEDKRGRLKRRRTAGVRDGESNVVSCAAKKKTPPDFVCLSRTQASDSYNNLWLSV